MTKVLVTGGSGFIGSHTCAYLLEKGFEVYILDSFVNSYPTAIDRISKICKIDKIKNNNYLHVIKGDIRNSELLNKIFVNAIKSGEPISGVIHFAGLKSVEQSFKDPLRYWEVNVNGTVNLLNAMHKYGTNTIVFSSSATIYGNPSNDFISENDEIKPINPYGSTKAVVERILNNLYESDQEKWKIANLRYFNAIGAHNSGLIGEDPHEKSNNLFPLLTQVANKKVKELKIFGNNWPTEDGTCIRDYIHVMDLAEAHFKTLKFLLGENGKLINLNIGNSKGISVIQLIKTFEKVNKIKIPYSFAHKRKGDVARLVADNYLASKILGWKPRRNLEQMCIDGWKWKKLNPEGYEKIF